MFALEFLMGSRSLWTILATRDLWHRLCVCLLRMNCSLQCGWTLNLAGSDPSPGCMSLWDPRGLSLHHLNLHSTLTSVFVLADCGSQLGGLGWLGTHLFLHLGCWAQRTLCPVTDLSGYFQKPAADELMFHLLIRPHAFTFGLAAVKLLIVGRFSPTKSNCPITDLAIF